MSAKFIFCEGRDDVAVISSLAGAIGLNEIIVEDFEGRDKLRGFLRAFRDRPEFVTKQIMSVGVILDADNDPNASWQRIHDAVRDGIGMELPAPGEFVGNLPRIAGWVMPGEGNAGMLETVCLESIQDRPQYACVNDFVRCVEGVTGRSLHPKAKFRAWMATQEDFARSLEREARSPGFPWTHSAFNGLRQFLSAL